MLVVTDGRYTGAIVALENCITQWFTNTDKGLISEGLVLTSMSFTALRKGFLIYQNQLSFIKIILTII